MFTLIIIVLVQSSAVFATENLAFQPSDKTPALTRQGPFGITPTSPADPFWFQTGAIGDASTYNYVAANITIRTVYDRVNGDAHSYWVGGFLSNLAFIQAGYLNEVSTTNQPYCCAWFFEYFPAGNSNCCAPVVGPQGSAGPIGSWHTYSMIHAGNGVWSFYMDGKILGSTPSLGALNSGNHAPAGIAEVAQASSNNDVLGPAEFKDMWYRTGATWLRVPSASSFIYYGAGTPLNPPPNLYGVAEVEGTDNDFLAGSDIPQLNSPSPTPGQQIWPAIVPPNPISLSFRDSDGVSFTPTWVSLRNLSGPEQAFFTRYQGQKIESGDWLVDKVIWHSVNVALQDSPIHVPTTTSAVVSANVFTISMAIVGWLSGLPVNGATVTTFLPDSLNITARTGQSGQVSLPQLPPGSYLIRVTVPYGIGSILTRNISGPGELSVRVVSSFEMALIIVLPIVGAVTIVAVAVWREKLRRESMPTIPASHTMIVSCANCGSPVHAGDAYCPSCGTPIRQVGP